MIVGFVGARNRSSLKDIFPIQELKEGLVTEEQRNQVIGKDKTLVYKLVKILDHKYGVSLTIVSMGCDDGIGLLVKQACSEMKVNFVEIGMHFIGERRAKAGYAMFYKARVAAMLEVVDESIMLKSDFRQSICDDILDRIKKGRLPQPYVVFDEAGRITENTTHEDFELDKVNV